MRIISGHVQNYAWGIPGGLNPWLAGVEDDGPQAELWFGAHPNGPSPLVGRAGVLTDVIDADRVPLLVKLLAASVPLSIQIHPRAELAREIYRTQDPEHPLLPDDRAKIEMLIALREFSVFAGTREVESAAQLLRASDPRLGPAAQALSRGGFTEGVRAVMDLPQEEVPTLISAVLAEAGRRLPTAAVQALQIAATAFPGDRGVLVALLLNQDTLPPGAAVYMPAGGAHAYVRGFGLEVMTASDNVLRLGMTPKAIALDEGLSAVDPDATPQVLPGPAGGIDDGSATVDYRPAGAPFKVTLVRESSAHSAGGKYRLALCLSGTANVSVGPAIVELSAGQAAVVLADEPTLAMDCAGLGFVIEHRPENDAVALDSTHGRPAGSEESEA